jgi:hypothetical protein
LQGAASQIAATADVADPVSASNRSLHELFEQQLRDMLEGADLGEEEEQTIRVAFGCPCCGAGGMSFSFKLHPRSPEGAQRNPGRPRRKGKR